MSTRSILSLNRPAVLPPRLAGHLKRLREDARPPAPGGQRQEADRGAAASTSECEAATAERIAHNRRAEQAFLERRAKDEAARTEHRRITGLLAELCPAVFGCPPAPLAIGAHRDLAALLAGEVDSLALARFLAQWTHRKAYLRALAAGEMRRDLNGRPTEVPTPEHRRITAEALARQERRKRAREERNVIRR